MLANELIDRLERLALLDQEIIEALREQLDQGGTRVTPEAVAKLLVDNGQLTRFQATKLIGELRSGQYDEGVEAAEVVEVSEELGILPEEGEVVEVVEAIEAEPVVEVVGEPMVAEAVPVEAVAVHAEAVAVEAVAAEPAVPADRPVPGRKKPEEENSKWDSFKIYGYLGIIGFLVIAGGGLYAVLSRKDADEFIKMGNELYDQQNYQGAQDRYLEFLDMFGENNEYSSLARTRVVMTQLYRAETMSDPTRALDLAKELLPQIENEEGLNEERGNLAAMLVDISDNIATVAGKATETPEKEKLLGDLQEMMTFMENPLYMTASMRTTLSGRMKTVEEKRARIKRDIDRNKSLDAAVAKMSKLLDDKNTKEAYDTRYALLKEFPELDTDKRLTDLILKASGIQKELVVPSAAAPKPAVGTLQQESLKSIVLTAMKGSESGVPALNGEIIYLRAGGSVLAFEGRRGGLLWRRFVGYGQDYAPVQLDGGVLLSDSSLLEVQRCKGDDGVLRWRSSIGEEFTEPVAVRDDVLAATKSGTIFSLDAESGETKWASQIPQPVEVSPGVDGRAGRAYLPGNHSNLYVLDSRNGSCLESYYVGHAEGTIAVPPVPLLGHLFVVENKGSGYCNVHVLKFDPTGQNLQRAQDPVRMTGNVIVPPTVVQQRRLIVLTDRGQVSVFDVEPTAENEQVTVVATQVATYDEPTATQMAVGRSQMWITGTQIARYELQINTGRIVPGWVKYSGDTFIGQPFSNEEALVHARVLQGTTAIRVTAADPKSGEELWRTDVGAPVSMIKQAAGGEFHAVTSQGSMFILNRETFDRGSTDGPSDNPGADLHGARFEDPVSIDETKAFLLNQETSKQILVYDPSRTREKIRIVQLQVQQRGVSGGATFSGGGVFLPLQNGRAITLDWQRGSPLGNPFQPASNPTANVTWTNPVVVPSDPDQVVIADSRKTLYRLRVGEQIRDLAKTELPSVFLGLATAVNDTLIATTAGPAADFIVGHQIISLKPKFQTLLDGRVAWGPLTAGDVALIQTEDGTLRAFDTSGEQRFAIELPKGQPIGKPLIAGDKLLLAGKAGWIVVIDPGTGKLVAQTQLGQPISTAPLLVGNQLLVPGAEGVVYITPVPSE